MKTQATNTQHRGRSRGFTLIEALVGVVVLSVGLLSIASLQTGTMTATGEAKARSEAMQIAEAQMEALRHSYSDRTEFNNLDDNFDGQSVVLDGSAPNLPVGTNAVYTVEWEVDAAENDTSGNPLLFLAGIRVSWKGPTDDPDDDTQEQAVIVASFINWDNPSGGAAATDAGDPSGGGTLISPPTGRAVQGGRVYQDADGNRDLPDGATQRTVSIGDTEITLDSYIYTAPDGSTELIGADGRVLLTIPSGETESTISGILYSTESIDSSNFEILASDASACERFSLDTAGVAYPDEYEVAEYYVCTVGPAWYGNIGVVRFGDAANNDRVCVGRPDYSEVPRWDSLHPALSTTRDYRGFKDRDPDSDTDLPISTGIGIDPDSGQYTPQTYVDHDFLLSNFGGNPDDDDCNTELAKNASLYDDSRGEGFCFTGSAEDDSGYCPDLNGGVTGGTTEVVVAIEHGWNNDTKFEQNAIANGSTLSDVVSMTGGVCEDTSTNQDLLVTCTISRDGFTGDTWSDTMLFQNLATDVGLCSLDSHTATSGTIEITDPNTIGFADIPLSYETIDLDVTVDENCP